MATARSPSSSAIRFIIRSCSGYLGSAQGTLSGVSWLSESSLSLAARRPKWVQSRSAWVDETCPLYPQKLSLPGRLARSENCKTATSNVQVAQKKRSSEGGSSIHPMIANQGGHQGWFALPAV